MIDLGKHNVLGVQVDAVDYETAVNRIVDAAQSRTPLAVSALAVHGLMTGVLDPTHRYRLNEFDLLTPDGQPVRWALKWLHRVPLCDRVYGPTLMLQVCARAAAARLPVYLFGGDAEILDGLAENLCARCAGLEIAGMRPSLFRRISVAERQRIIAEIRASGALIAFVGLGCPRQEIWAYEFREALSMPVVAVGAAFAFHAGRLRQAPMFMQRRGLEWLFRLLHEPRRLWHRYLVLNPLYLALLLLQWSGIREFNVHDATPPTKEILYG